MAIDETIRYNVELDTAQLSEQLSQVRQQVDGALSSTSVGASSPMSVSALQSQAMQNQSMIQTLIDRSESFGMQQLEQIKSDNFAFRIGNLPESMSQRSALENALGAVIGLGYDPFTSRMTMGEYMRESNYNFAVRIPIIGTESSDDIRLANYLRQVSRASLGGEFRMGDAVRLADQIRDLDLNPEFSRQGFTRSRVMGLVNTMASQGDFIGIESPAEMQEKITEAMKSVTTVMANMRQAMEEAVQTQSAIRSLGVDATQVGEFSALLRGRGAAVGLSPLEMLATAQAGGQLSAAMGIHPLIGSMGMMDLMQEYAYGRRSGDMDSWRIKAMGGEMGAAMQTAQAAQRINASPYGMYLLAQGRDINSYGDYADLVVEGMYGASSRPQQTVWGALEGVADIWASLGDSATPQRVALLAEQMGLMPFNVAWTQMQAAANIDFSERSQTAVRAGIEAQSVYASQITPGGVYGAGQDFLTGFRKWRRDLANTVDISSAAQDIRSSLDYNILKKYTTQELKIPDITLVGQELLSNYVSAYNPNMKQGLKTTADYGPATDFDEEDPELGTQYGLNEVVRGLTVATGITDKDQLLSLFSKDGEAAEIFRKTPGIKEKDVPELLDAYSSYLYGVGAEYGKFDVNDAEQQIGKLDAKTRKEVAESLAVVYRHQSAANALTERLAGKSDLEKDIYFASGAMEKELVAKLYGLVTGEGVKVVVDKTLERAQTVLENNLDVPEPK